MRRQTRMPESDLTAPGAPFEVTVEDVRGERLPVYRHRLRSMRELLRVSVERFAPREYLVYGDERVTFAQFGSQADAVAAGLADRGVGRGDRVAVLAANKPEWVQAAWAAMQMGAIPVALNGWWTGDEILYALLDSTPKVLVADAARLRRIAPRLGETGLEAVALVDAEESSDLLDLRCVEPFDRLLDALDAPAPATPIEEDDPAILAYTSGTTGRPRGAITTHRALVASVQNVAYLSAVAACRSGTAVPRTRERLAALLTPPLFHVSGFNAGAVVGMAAGVTQVMPVGRFEPERAMQLIEAERITHWSTVPTMVWRVIEHEAVERYDLSSVRRVSYGGSPSAGELHRRVRQTFPNVRVQSKAYGLTESCGMVTHIDGEDFAARPDSVGKPLPIVELRIVDGAEATVPSGTVGEIHVRSCLVTPGFWNRPPGEGIGRGGWLATGDLGYLDSDGFLYVTDRAKDVIIRGGENVYCVEIENRLEEHPAIAEAAVVGVPHPVLGEEVKAFVRLVPGESLSESAVRCWVADRLAPFKVPAHVEVVDEHLPRNPSGKVLKAALRARAGGA